MSGSLGFHVFRWEATQGATRVLEAKDILRAVKWLRVLLKFRVPCLLVCNLAASCVCEHHWHDRFCSGHCQKIDVGIWHYYALTVHV